MCRVCWFSRLRAGCLRRPREPLESGAVLSGCCSSHLCHSSLLQFRYKRRVYTQALLDDKQFAKLHTKVRMGSSWRAPSPGGPFSTAGGLSQRWWQVWGCSSLPCLPGCKWTGLAGAWGALGGGAS